MMFKKECEMKDMKFEEIKGKAALNFITNILNCNKYLVAAILDVSTKTLDEWALETLSEHSLDKSVRLHSLHGSTVGAS